MHQSRVTEALLDLVREGRGDIAGLHRGGELVNGAHGIDGQHVEKPPRRYGALLHESSLARTMPTDRILTCRCDMTLAGRALSSD